MQETYVKYRYKRQRSKWLEYRMQAHASFEKRLEWRCCHFVGAYKY